MARYISDQNKVLGIHESGTYAFTSGNAFWIGQVTDHTVDDAENVLINRFLGTADRNLDKFDSGPRDVTGTITYKPQNMRLVFFGIGSVNDVSGTQARHIVTEINTDVPQNAFTSEGPVSFTIEDSKQSPGTGRNFIRTIIGAVPNVTTITATQGEKVEVTIDYIAQSLQASSGTTTTLIENTSDPFLWSEAKLSIGVGANVGSVLDTAKTVSLEINQNRTGPHYLNGSRVIGIPFNGNREYTLSVDLDLDGTDADMLYNNFYKDGNEFHAEFDIDGDTTTGSKHVLFVMSGCRIISMDNPSALEGTTETTIEIKPTTLSAEAWEIGVEDGIYNIF
ncbi:MAG: hypothetical protein IIA87_03710 [Nanoarchaeota archaeon]|nr:hypothetical protein [Nanoarchaeota archaeon]